MTSPKCFGWIDLYYDSKCHTCKYASMCAYIVITERWDDKEPETEDIKKT